MATNVTSLYQKYPINCSQFSSQILIPIKVISIFWVQALAAFQRFVVRGCFQVITSMFARDKKTFWTKQTMRCTLVGIIWSNIGAKKSDAKEHFLWWMPPLMQTTFQFHFMNIFCPSISPPILITTKSTKNENLSIREQAILYLTVQLKEPR